MKRLVVIGSGMALVIGVALVLAFAALGGNRAGGVADPFAYNVDSGSDSGPESGLWGDGGGGPNGLHLGCIPGRRFAMAIVIDNQTNQAFTILGVAGSQARARLIRSVAVQVWPKPEVSNGLFQSGLHVWSRTPGKPLTVPAESDVWVQLNYVMGKCALIRPRVRLAFSDSLTITYQDATGATGLQAITGIVPLILTRASKAAIAHYRHNPNAG